MADPLDEIRNGVRAAMQVSYRRLRRLGYSRAIAQAELLRMTREAIHQAGDE